MTKKKDSRATEQEIKDFRAALEIMNMTLIRFCQIVAVEEGNEDADQENKIEQNVKKRFSNKRGMTKNRLQMFWRYLSEQEGFDKVNMVILPSAMPFIRQSKFADAMLDVFND